MFSSIFITFCLCVCTVFAQSSTTLSQKTSINIQTSTTGPLVCRSNINNLSGRCLVRDQCTGATLTSVNCKKDTICCVNDTNIPLNYPSNQLISLNKYLSLVGNSVRTRALYTAFSKSIADAGLSDCHQVAAYLANVQGESDNFLNFEERRDDFGKYDYETSLGNAESNDGSNYRGRGALLLRGKRSYELANSQLNLPVNIVYQPERAAFPSIAFQTAAWQWKNNYHQITSKEPSKKGTLTLLADGTLLNFTLLSNSISQSYSSLQERIIYYENAVNVLECRSIKRGQGVDCEFNDLKGKAVPICTFGLVRSWCGCEGPFSVELCPYGFSQDRCRSPEFIKCCVEKCTAYLDLVIVLDSSGSIGDIDFVKAKNFVKQLVGELDVGFNSTRVSIVNYGDDVQTITKLNNQLDKQTLLNTIANIQYLKQNTNTQAALEVVNSQVLTASMGMRPLEEGVPKVVVIITDGASNVKPELTLPNAEKIKNRGVSIISVGVGKSLNQKELEGMATNKEDVYNVDNYEKIFEIIESLTKTACEQPAKADFEIQIQSDVPQQAYKYFALDFPNGETNSFTIELKILEGDSDIAFSFNNTKPKLNQDYVNVKPNNEYIQFIEKNLRVKRSLHAEYSAKDTTKSKFIQIRRQFNESFLYLGVKGFQVENKFALFIYNRTIEVPSSSSNLLNGSLVCLLSGILFLIF